MTNDRTTPIWDMFALLLWAAVFAAGLVPDLAFEGLRRIANVSPSHAIVNSSYAITLGIAGYVAVFVLQRCRDAGAAEPEARAKALMAAFMAFTAFLELPNRGTSPFEPRTFLDVWINFRMITDTYARNVVLLAGIAKLFCWWYLFALLLRYYAFGNSKVFRSLPPIVPGPHRTGRPPKVPAPTSESTNGKHNAEEPKQAPTEVAD